MSDGDVRLTTEIDPTFLFDCVSLLKCHKNSVVYTHVSVVTQIDKQRKVLKILQLSEESAQQRPESPFTPGIAIFTKFPRGGASLWPRGGGGDSAPDPLMNTIAAFETVLIYNFLIC